MKEPEFKNILARFHGENPTSWKLAKMTPKMKAIERMVTELKKQPGYSKSKQTFPDPRCCYQLD